MRRLYGYSGLLLLGFAIFGCDRILGPRHSALIRLDDPAWKTPGTGSMPDNVATARDILEHRLAFAGASGVRSDLVVGEPKQVRLSYRGNVKAHKLLQLLGNAGRLEIHLVKVDKTWASRESTLADSEIKGILPVGTGLYPSLTDMENPAEVWYLLESDATFTGADLHSASATTDEAGRPAIGFTLNVEAGVRFKKFTEQNIKRKLAIVLNQHVVTTPVIESPIGANGIIHGAFTDEEVALIAEELNSGDMPLQPVILEMK